MKIFMEFVTAATMGGCFGMAIVVAIFNEPFNFQMLMAAGVIIYSLRKERRDGKEGE